MADEMPVYDWDYATIGDAVEPVTVEVRAEKVQEYVEAQDDTNPVYSDVEVARQHGVQGPGIPVPMVRIYAPLLRREVVERKGARYPDFATPVPRWTLRLFAPPKVGDRITSVTRLRDKFVKNDRHFLQWQVESFNQDGEKVSEFYYTNLWDAGKPEDRDR